MFDQVWLIYLLIFLCAFLLVEGVLILLADGIGGRRKVNRRMRMLETGQSRASVYTQLRRRASAEAERFGPFADAYAKLDALVTSAGISLPTQRILLLMAGLGGGSALAVLAAGHVFRMDPLLVGLPAALAVGALLGILLPVMRLRMIAAKRIQTFHRQLPDALDCMVRSLQAGHPVSAALSMVAQEMPDPIGTEFGIAVDEMTYGLELAEALHNMSERVPLEEFRYVIVAINIQMETGGNLAEVLEALSEVIRSRFRMFMKVRALSAEGRMSMKILAALPVVFALMAFTTQPHFYLDVAGDPLFWPIVAGALVLQITGILIMRKLVNFRV